MKQLIRFEDDYGMSDIVCIAQGLGLQDIESNRLTHQTLKPNTLTQSGLSIGAVFDISDLILSEIITYRIGEIVFVFDMDAISGRGIMTESEIANKVNNVTKRLKDIDITIKYAPVVWSAETIELYAMLDIESENCGIIEKCTDITHIVHSKNTAKLHGELLKRILNHLSMNCKVKHTREFIGGQEDIVCKLTDIINNYEHSINKNILQWIVTGDTKYLFDSNNVIDHQRDIVQLHNKYMPQKGDTIMVYGDELSLTKVCWR